MVLFIFDESDRYLNSICTGKHEQNASVCKFDPAKIGHVIKSDIDKMSVKISKNNYLHTCTHW